MQIRVHPLCSEKVVPVVRVKPRQFDVGFNAFRIGPSRRPDCKESFWNGLGKIEVDDARLGHVEKDLLQSRVREGEFEAARKRIACILGERCRQMAR